MDNLQRSWLMGYDAGTWGIDTKNDIKGRENITGDEIEWWLAGFSAGAKSKERMVKPLILSEGKNEPKTMG